MHCDDDDRSFACWVSRNRPWSGRPLSRHWHLLFPRHGLVVTLVHGTWISWGGVAQPHCTAVPAVAPGDELYSAFCSISAPTVTSLTRTNHCEVVMRERVAQSSTVTHVFDTLCVGDRVFMRWHRNIPAGMSAKRVRIFRKLRKNVRWVECKIITYTEPCMSGDGDRRSLGETGHACNRESCIHFTELASKAFHCFNRDLCHRLIVKNDT